MFKIINVALIYIVIGILFVVISGFAVYGGYKSKIPPQEKRVTYVMGAIGMVLGFLAIFSYLPAYVKYRNGQYETFEGKVEDVIYRAGYLRGSFTFVKCDGHEFKLPFFVRIFKGQKVRFFLVEDKVVAYSVLD